MRFQAVQFAILVPGATELTATAAPSWRGSYREWTKVVEHLGASFLRGDAAVDPKYGRKSCEFCELHSLCRIAEVRALDAAGGRSR